MQQLEIKFFWPLTEQIPLDLDYTGCERPKLSAPLATSCCFIDTNGTWGTTVITSQHLVIDTNTTEFVVSKKPGAFKRALMKILDMKWVVKGS